MLPKQKLLQVWQSQAFPVSVPSICGTWNPCSNVDHGFIWSSLPEHSVLFYSEDNKPKALTNRDGWSCSCRGTAAVIWNLGIGCITPMCYGIILIGLNGYSNQSPSICTHRQGKGTSFFASLQLLHTKNNSWGGTKDESHSSGIFWTGHGWCWTSIGWKKGCPYCATLC